MWSKEEGRRRLRNELTSHGIVFHFIERLKIPALRSCRAVLGRDEERAYYGDGTSHNGDYTALRVVKATTLSTSQQDRGIADTD
jgi:hypothetical protein